MIRQERKSIAVKRFLKIFLIVAALAMLASCASLIKPNETKPDGGKDKREEHKVAFVYSEGITYEGKNPIMVKDGASLTLDITLDPTYIIVEVENASYDPLTRQISIESVTSDVRIRALAEDAGYDTASQYNYNFCGGELDSTSIASMENMYSGTEITVSAGDKSLIFRGWSLGDYAENGGQIISEERDFTFMLSADFIIDGVCAIYPNYAGEETNVLYYDLNGGSVNTASRNMSENKYYTAEVDGEYVKVTLGETYYEKVGACACIFWDDGTFYRDGYVLAEFNTKADGSGEGYGSGYKFSLKTGASILYCIWKPVSATEKFIYTDCEIKRPSGVSTAKAPDWHENGIRIIRYLGNENEVVIPETIDGKAVISIAEGAFQKSSTRTIVLSKYLLEIQDGAFQGLARLDTMYYPDSVYYVSDNILDETTKASLQYLYVNATMAPRYTCGSESYAHKFARYLANADKNRVVLMAGSSGLYGLSGGYLEALLDEEYCVVNFGMVMSVTTSMALAVTSYYAHDGDILLYCPETSIRNWGTDHLYWKGAAYIEGMYNAFRVLNFTYYNDVFNSFAEINQGSKNVTSRYTRSQRYYEEIQSQNTYCEADTAKRYYLNDGTAYSYKPSLGGKNFSFTVQNPDVGGNASLLDEKYVRNLNALIAIAHENGAKVYNGFPPIVDRSVDPKIRENIDEVIATYEAGIMEAYDFDGLLGTAKDYIFHTIYFYDSAYHPNNYGKTYRTYQVYVDLCEILGITDINGYYDVGTKDDFFATLFEEGVVDGKPLIEADIAPIK